jgi:TrmH family RNA methyltransferase
LLAEGAQAVREALRAGAVLELFATAEAAARHPELAVGADEISVKDAAALSETVTPQGLVAVCALAQPPADDVLARGPQLAVLLVEPNDPGNLGTIIRTADAAGADAVFVSGGADPYNGKAVRASAGSLFHLPVVPVAAGELLAVAAAAGLQRLATTGVDGADRAAGRPPVALGHLDRDGRLAAPTLWVFGSEAAGLPTELLAAADERVRIEMYGAAESLNLAAAAAVVLFTAARAQRT